MKTAQIDMQSTKYFQLSGISSNYLKSLRRAKQKATETQKNLRPLLGFINGLCK